MMTMTSSPSTHEAPLAGTRYRAVCRIGGGSASDVYAATGANGERCAVKLLRTLYAASSEVSWRLEQEGRALASLRHPNIVRIQDAGVTRAGRPYLVMPLLMGETLRERLDARGARPVHEALDLVAGALDGLACAHRAGIVHRDIKPANLFIVEAPELAGDEHMVVLDFGIAKIVDETFGPTTSSHVMGTPRYLSPEQILGGEVDARTDVYAIGVVLHEALSGRAPFATSCAMETMRAHLEDTPASLHAVAGVSPLVASIALRALEKNPARRWASAAQMAAAMRAARQAECVR
jgi:serine/threonine-protein kinase